MSTASHAKPGMQTLVLVSLLSSLAGGLFASVASVTVASAWRSGGGEQSFEVTEAGIPGVGVSAGRRNLLQVPTSVLSYNAATKELTITAKAIKLVSTAGGKVTVAKDVTLSTAAGGSVVVAPSAQPIKFTAVTGNSVDITKDGNIIRFLRSGDVRGLQLFGADTASLLTRSSAKPTSGIKIQTAPGALGNRGAVFIAPGGRQLRVSQGTKNVDVADTNGNIIRFEPKNFYFYGEDTICLVGGTGAQQCLA
ncbi:hypothetical protein ACK3TF_004853 [Chlorella vulgaris]